MSWTVWLKRLTKHGIGRTPARWLPTCSIPTTSPECSTETRSYAKRLLVAQHQGDELGISTTVLGELFYAAYASERQEHNLQRIEELVAYVRMWVYDTDAAKEFGAIRAELRRQGRPIPPMDAQIAAVARINGLTVLTADQHFPFVVGLSVENWLENRNL